MEVWGIEKQSIVCDTQAHMQIQTVHTLTIRATSQHLALAGAADTFIASL